MQTLFINERLDENKREEKGYEQKVIDHRPLNGDLVCGSCGSNLAGYERKKKVKSTGETRYFHYYRCFKCNAIHINANTTPKALNEGLHDQFIEILKQINLSDKLKTLVEKNLLMILKNRSEELKKEQKQIKIRLTELRKEFEAIEERFAFGKIPENIYQKYAEKLTSDIYELEEKNSDDNFSTANL